MATSARQVGVHDEASYVVHRLEDNRQRRKTGPCITNQRIDPCSKRICYVILLITGTFMIIEVVGGLLTGSLALLADAGHMLTDVAALGLSAFAMCMAARQSTPSVPT